MVRTISRKRYLVAIPVPSLDQKGERLDEDEVHAVGKGQELSDRTMGRVQVVEIVEDDELRRKTPAATKAFRRFFPEAPALAVYRTSDGRFGFQAHLALAAGDRARFEKAYRAVMQVLGETRGRPAGARKVQAKLRLREPVYRRLRMAAKRSGRTVSELVEELASKAGLV
jgi:hypothetical protein